MNPSHLPRTKWRIVHSEASLGWGGQEHRVLTELIGFKKRGSSVYLIAPVQSQIAIRAKLADIEVLEVSFTKKNYPKDFLRIKNWLKVKKIQILCPHSSRDGWLVALAGRFAKVPFIIRYRHIDVQYKTPEISQHAFVTLADHIITTSEKIRQHFISEFKVDPSQISCLATGIDINRFQKEGPKADLWSNTTFANQTKPVVGMISVLRGWKGHSTFFQAIKILNQRQRKLRYLVVGGGADINLYRSWAQQLGVADQILFTGHREDVDDILRVLNILLIPSILHEGVPQIGLQALATEVPVVGSTCGGIPEIIQPNFTGRIFPIKDATALADAIESTLDQPELTLQYTKNGRQLIETQYSTEILLDQLEDIYLKKLGQSRPLKSSI
jgi:glycosyltransferase involved in cell wall biosynthesis